MIRACTNNACVAFALGRDIRGVRTTTQSPSACEADGAKATLPRPQRLSPTPAQLGGKARAMAPSDPDLAFGAFQRGRYICSPALPIAPPSGLSTLPAIPRRMTLWAELYATLWGRPNDAKNGPRG